MKKIKSLILLVLKGILFFSLPILLFLFTLYEIVFDVGKDFSWLRTSLYAILWGVILIIPYSRKTVEEPQERLEGLESRIRDRNWKVTEKTEIGYILRPKINFPYNTLGRESVHVEYSNGVSWIEGSTYYVDILLNEIKGKKNIWGTRGVKALFSMLILTIIALPILVEAGVIERLKVEYHNFQAGHVEKLEITDENAMGNTVNNTNNYGFGAAYDDHIFYVEDGFNLVRITKEFQDKTYLIEKSSGWGISRLNIVEGWIFYHSGKTLSRMRTDGTKNEVLYGMGFLSDIHVQGSWIYFLNSSDEFAVYRMDVNGENLEKIVDREALNS